MRGVSCLILAALVFVSSGFTPCRAHGGGGGHGARHSYGTPSFHSGSGGSPSGGSIIQGTPRPGDVDDLLHYERQPARRLLHWFEHLSEAPTH